MEVLDSPVWTVEPDRVRAKLIKAIGWWAFRVTGCTGNVVVVVRARNYFDRICDLVESDTVRVVLDPTA